MYRDGRKLVNLFQTYGIELIHFGVHDKARGATMAWWIRPRAHKQGVLGSNQSA